MNFKGNVSVFSVNEGIFNDEKKGTSIPYYYAYVDSNGYPCKMSVDVNVFNELKDKCPVKDYCCNIVVRSMKGQFKLKLVK